MDSEKKYQLGLLYLIHLLINADGIVNENETKELLKIRDKEKISTTLFDQFISEVRSKKAKEIYQEED